MTVTAIEEQALAREIAAIQQGWAGKRQEHGWFAELALAQVITYPSGLVVLVLADRWGQRYGWRWHTAGEPLSDTSWPLILRADLEGNLSGCGWSAPDEAGIRWMQPVT